MLQSSAKPSIWLAKIMSDFHVVSLTYRLQPGEHVSYSNPPPLVFENETARFHLEKGELRCEMKLHVATVEQARALVDPILRDWEMEVELTRNRGELRFIYEDAEIIDRTPPTPGVQARVMKMLGGSYLVTMGNVTGHVMRRKYPDAPMGFHVTPDAESILLRFRNYQDGREQLLSMAYFCLTVVESAAGGRNRRDKAAKMFGISERVLSKLGDLTTKHGDLATARKAQSNARPLTGNESAWIEATIKQLVLRLCDPPPHYKPKQLTMADLPCL
jgi:hypothetical protein